MFVAGYLVSARRLAVVLAWCQGLAFARLPADASDSITLAPHDQALLGVLTAQMVEATDRYADFGSANVQRLVQTTLSTYEQTARAPKVAAAFDRLKGQFSHIASAQEKASDLRALQLARSDYLAQLPDGAQAANEFGALVQQISYNAEVLHDASADGALRARLANVCSGPIPTTYQQACTQLAVSTPKNLDIVHRLAAALVNRVTSDAASSDRP